MTSYPPTQKPGGGGEAASYYNDATQQHPAIYSIPPPAYEPPRFDGDKPPEYSFEEKFAVKKPKYNDIWAGVLFVACVLGFAAVSALAIRGYATTRRIQGTGIYDDNSNDFGLSTNTLILFIFILGMSFTLSWVYLQAVRYFTKQIIYVTAIANILVGLGTALFYFQQGSYGAGIIFLIFAIFYAICFWSWRSRIPFAVVMLQTAIDIAKRFGHVFLVSFLGGIVALAFGAWFVVTFVAVYARYTPSASNPACAEGGCSRGKVIGLLIFVTFCGYWVTEFIKNAMHMTVSGVYGSWYFCANTPAGMPRRPTIGAFKRTMTYSFGSVSFGSLIVSLIQLLKQACSIAQHDAAMDGNIVLCMIFCILRCLIGFVEWAVQFFNHYAFSLIALYGKAYIPAAKDTWKMMKSRGLDALINDVLIDPVLTMAAVFMGYLSALLAYLYLKFTSPAYNNDGAYTPVILVFSFLAGLQIANTILNPLKSGVSTIFVAMAWDPAVMMRNHRQLYDRIASVYPRIHEAISAV